MRAYWRDDLEEEGEYPPSCPALPKQEWDKGLQYDVIDCGEFETEEGYNMLIRHPETKIPLLVMSIDFDFKHYVVKEAS